MTYCFTCIFGFVSSQYKFELITNGYGTNCYNHKFDGDVSIQSNLDLHDGNNEEWPSWNIEADYQPSADVDEVNTGT